MHEVRNGHRFRDGPGPSFIHGFDRTARRHASPHVLYVGERRCTIFEALVVEITLRCAGRVKAVRMESGAVQLVGAEYSPTTCCSCQPLPLPGWVMSTRTKRSNHSRMLSLIFLIIFGSAFGYVEATVIYYIRQLIDFHTNYGINNYKVLLNLGFITFISPSHPILINNRINDIEIIRETATIIMLISIAYVAGKDLKQRIGAFLITFATWDIMYYVALKFLDNWPSSLMTRDVYFLIPVTWIGPVITPLVISTIMLILGSWLYLFAHATSET